MNSDSTDALGKITVGVPFGCDDDPSELARLGECLDGFEGDLETVVVIHGTSQEQSKDLLAVLEGMSDTTMFFIDDEIDDDVACLIAIDNAIGNWILLTKVSAPVPDLWRDLIAAGGSDNEVVTIQPSTCQNRPGWIRSAVLTAYRRISRLPIDARLPLTRLYSRAAGLYLIGRPDNTMLFRCSDLGAGFPATRVQPGPSAGPACQPMSYSLRSAFRALATANAFPIRSTVFLSLAAASINAIYSLYSLAVYLLKENVVPGWTTQTLQMSGMFFLFSIIFAVVGERLVSIERAVTHRLRYNVIRDVRSRRSRATGLNVVQGSDAD